MSTAHQNSRASLLSGLRTGGVRSTSVPYTAAPGGSFGLPRYAKNVQSVFPEEDEDQILEFPQNSYATYGGRPQPVTAAVDGPNNQFLKQQTRGLNPYSAPFNPGFNPVVAQNQAQQAFQLQMMQLELLKMQAQQQAQFQVEMMAQAQRQQQQQNRRASTGLQQPATAGPVSNGFDLRSATLSAQLRRSNQSGSSENSQLPMTAALGGKFGGRSVGGPVIGSGMQRYVMESEDYSMPSTPNSTTVISGGTSLGSMASNNINALATPSKSDSVSSWRRGGNNNSVISGINRAVTSPSVKITPPPADRSSPPAPATAIPKFRPQPLHFNPAAQEPLPCVAIDSSEGTDNDDESSVSSSKSGSNGSSPTTPRSSSSHEMPLSPREEASKKLYEGLGIGRPRSAMSNNGIMIPSVIVNDDSGYNQVSIVHPPSALASHRMASQPTRQPRGPPSGADELGPKNFASRIRRKAIGDLGMFRERKIVEVY